jgi:hypothetical protein
MEAPNHPDRASVLTAWSLETLKMKPKMPKKVTRSDKPKGYLSPINPLIMRRLSIKSDK